MDYFFSSEQKKHGELITVHPTCKGISRQKYIWRIENFTTDDRDFYVSPIFYADSGIELLWTLVLYPNEDGFLRRGRLDLEGCKKKKSDDETRLRFSVSYAKNISLFPCGESERGFMLNSDITVDLEPGKYGVTLINNNLSIPFEVFTDYDQISKITHDYKCSHPDLYKCFHTDRYKCFHTDRYKCFHTDQYKCFHADRFETLLNNPEFSDVRFIVDGMVIHAHRNIICVSSPIFAEMIKIKKMNVIVIPKFPYEAFKELLRFIYCGKVYNLDCVAEDLLMLSYMYEVDGLKVMCSDSICEKFTLDNISDYLSLAYSCGSEKFKNEAVKFVVDHRKELLRTPYFSKFMKLKENVLSNVFSALLIK